MFVFIFSIIDCSSLSVFVCIIIFCLLRAFYCPDYQLSFSYCSFSFFFLAIYSWKVSNARRLYCSNFRFVSIYLLRVDTFPYLILFLKVQLQASFVNCNHRSNCRMDQTPLTQNVLRYNVLRWLFAGASRIYLQKFFITSSVIFARVLTKDLWLIWSRSTSAFVWYISS